MSDNRAERAIVDLHRFFACWLSGSIEKTEAEFSRLERALDPEFTMVNPDGSTTTRATVVEGLRASHAAVPGLVIEIANVNQIARAGNLAVVSYDELQRAPGINTGRRSTATFVIPDRSGEDYRWRHVHETWFDTIAPT